MLNAPWVHTSRSRPCPICRRDKNGNRCILIPDQVVLCYYVESRQPKPTTAGQAWLHFLTEARPRAISSIKRFTARLQRPTPGDLRLLAQKFHSRITDQRVAALSRDLGVSAEALRQLDVGWSDGEPMFIASRGTSKAIHAWSFPRRNAAGEVIGLSMRPMLGGKFAWTGSGGGLHIPRNFVFSGRACLCEGPSDAAAAIDLGFNAFGRTSCSSDVDHVLALLKRGRFEQLVIFSQRDEAHYRINGSVYYPAQDGSRDLVQGTSGRQGAIGFVRDIRLVMPPAHPGDKDWRDWKRRGATAADVEQLIQEATPWRITAAVQIHGRKGTSCQTTQPH